MAFSSATSGYLIISQFGGSASESGFLLRTSDGGKSWHPQFIVSDPIQSRGLASGGGTDYILTRTSRLLYTQSGGDRGQRSTLSITPSVRKISKPETMQVTGVLKPAAGFEQVVVSLRPAGSNVLADARRQGRLQRQVHHPVEHAAQGHEPVRGPVAGRLRLRRRGDPDRAGRRRAEEDEEVTSTAGRNRNPGRAAHR